MSTTMYLAALAVTAGALVGCAPMQTQGATDRTRNELRGADVASTARRAPNFIATRPGTGMFGLLGAPAMISEGKSIVEGNAVEDPARFIASQMLVAMQQTQGSRILASAVPASSDNVEEVAAAAKGQARFVIDVQTTVWSFAYFPTDWSHYRVMYGAKARLIDTDSGTVVAEGVCGSVPEATAGAPTHDELLANQAARLKHELATAAGNCVSKFKREMLAL